MGVEVTMQMACLGCWGVELSGSAAQQEELRLWSAEKPACVRWKRMSVQGEVGSEAQL